MRAPLGHDSAAGRAVFHSQSGPRKSARMLGNTPVPGQQQRPAPPLCARPQPTHPQEPPDKRPHPAAPGPGQRPRQPPPPPCAPGAPAAARAPRWPPGPSRPPCLWTASARLKRQQASTRWNLLAARTCLPPRPTRMQISCPPPAPQPTRAPPHLVSLVQLEHRVHIHRPRGWPSPACCPAVAGRRAGSPTCRRHSWRHRHTAAGRGSSRSAALGSGPTAGGSAICCGTAGRLAFGRGSRGRGGGGGGSCLLVDAASCRLWRALHYLELIPAAAK